MRLVVPVEYVLAALPGAELVTHGRWSRIILSEDDGGWESLPVIEVEETEGVEWPEIFQP